MLSEACPEISESAPLACLFTENPNRLVSLWDMLRTQAGDFSRACSIFGQMCSTIREDKKPDWQTFQVVSAELELLERNCQTAGLDASMVQARRAKKQLSSYIADTHAISLDQLDQCFSELSNRISDELGARFVFTLPREAAELYSEPLKYWEIVADRWPEIAFDITESSKCMALERYGAAIFHILLVAEFGAIKLADLMGKSGDKPGWGSIDRLAGILRKPYSDRSSHEQQHWKLLENTVPMLQSVKNQWRHKLDHIDNKLIWLDTDFSPKVASEITSATRGFMRGLAQELP